MRTTDKRFGRGLIILGLALACALWGWDTRAAQTSRFDKLKEEDRQKFSKRFEKEIWPLMTRGGKDSCINCHKPVHLSSMRIKDKEADKVFRMLLKQGFFLPDDVGTILYRVSSKDPEERMPPNEQPAWTDEEIQRLQQFVLDLDKKQQK